MTIIIATVRRADTPEFTTTSTTLTQADSLAVNFPVTATYIIHYSYELTSSSTSGTTTASLFFDSVEIGTGYTKPSAANAYTTISHNIPVVNVAAGNHTVALKIKSSSTSYTAKTRRIYLTIREE
jgi:hypothetical protein